MKGAMQLALDTVRAHLADRFGERVTNARVVLKAHGGSEAYHAPQPPDLVAFPESTDEVREIVGICAARGKRQDSRRRSGRLRRCRRY
jgi:D-lactate dehydrogenase (cytochrome)